MHVPDKSAVAIVVLGLTGAGKTTLITHAAEIQVISKTRSVSSGPDGSRPVDHKQITVDGDLIVEITSAPLSPIPDHMAAKLVQKTTGIVFVIDASDSSTFNEAGRAIKMIHERFPAPLTVAANKQDLPGSHTMIELRAALHLAPDISLMPCVAADTKSVNDILLEALYSVFEVLEEQEEDK